MHIDNVALLSGKQALCSGQRPRGIHDKRLRPLKAPRMTGFLPPATSVKLPRATMAPRARRVRRVRHDTRPSHFAEHIHFLKVRPREKQVIIRFQRHILAEIARRTTLEITSIRPNARGWRLCGSGSCAGRSACTQGLRVGMAAAPPMLAGPRPGDKSATRQSLRMTEVAGPTETLPFRFTFSNR